MSPPILVFHAPGDASAGEPWRRALADAGWDGPILAPDLPGHGDAPPPIGGHHDLADPAFAAVRLLADAGLGTVRPVVVGVGAHGWPAQLVALGGRAQALVLVDGLGSPWRTPAKAMRRTRERLRGLTDDPAALAPFSGPGLDPRLAYVLRPHGSRSLARRAAAAMTVPTLVLESPASGTPDEDRTPLTDAWGGEASIVDVADRMPATVAAAVLGWWHRRTPT